MKVISLMNCKGGTGKTTLCINLARAIQRDDDPSSIMMVDCDTTRNLSDWYDASEGRLAGLNVIGASNRQTVIGAESIAKNNGAEYLLIDTPGDVQALHGTALAISNMVIVPIKAGPLDSWATVDTIRVVRSAMITNEKLKAVFVINQVSGKKFLSDMIDYLKGYDDFHTCVNFVTNRQSFILAINEGQTVYELKAKHKPKLAIKDINKVTTELLEVLWREDFINGN